MKHSRSSLFLMELIIAILFFSLASAVCIQLFAKAHTLSLQTVNQNNAVTQAQSLAEAWLASEGNTETMRRCFENSFSSDDGMCLSLFFDKNWQALSDRNSPEIYYVAELENSPTTGTDSLINATISVYRQSGEAIYSLELSHHIAEKRGDKR